jgi:hypothetical protein
MSLPSLAALKLDDFPNPNNNNDGGFLVQIIPTNGKNSRDGGKDCLPPTKVQKVFDDDRMFHFVKKHRTALRQKFEEQFQLYTTKCKTAILETAKDDFRGMHKFMLDCADKKVGYDTLALPADIGAEPMLFSKLVVQSMNLISETILNSVTDDERDQLKDKSLPMQKMHSLTDVDFVLDTDVGKRLVKELIDDEFWKKEYGEEGGSGSEALPVLDKKYVALRVSGISYERMQECVLKMAISEKGALVAKRCVETYGPRVEEVNEQKEKYLERVNLWIDDIDKDPPRDALKTAILEAVLGTEPMEESFTAQHKLNKRIAVLRTNLGDIKTRAERDLDRNVRMEVLFETIGNLFAIFYDTVESFNDARKQLLLKNTFSVDENSYAYIVDIAPGHLPRFEKMTKRWRETQELCSSQTDDEVRIFQSEWAHEVVDYYVDDDPGPHKNIRIMPGGLHHAFVIVTPILNPPPKLYGFENCSAFKHRLSIPDAYKTVCDNGGFWIWYYLRELYYTHNNNNLANNNRIIDNINFEADLDTACLCLMDSYYTIDYVKHLKGCFQAKTNMSAICNIDSFSKEVLKYIEGSGQYNKWLLYNKYKIKDPDLDDTPNPSLIPEKPSIDDVGGAGGVGSQNPLRGPAGVHRLYKIIEKYGVKFHTTVVVRRSQRWKQSLPENWSRNLNEETEPVDPGFSVVNVSFMSTTLL